MIDNEVLEGNILIAKFMGGVYYDSWKCPTYMMPYPLFAFVEEEVYIDARNLSYHSSWDALMPVVEKIESMGYGFHKTPHDLDVIEYLSGNENKIIAYQNDPDDTLIQKWHYVVTEFIKWYNQQSK